MDKYRIKILKQAYEDIAYIKDVIISEYGFVEDAQYVEDYIFDRISDLEYLPNSHRLFRYANNLEEPIRIITAHRKYDIYYTVDKPSKEVIVQLVIHNKRDIRDQLDRLLG